MGYYSDLNDFSFASKLTAYEINNKFKSFCDAVSGNDELQKALGTEGDDYPLDAERFKFKTKTTYVEGTGEVDCMEDDCYVVVADPGDFRAKHYSSRGLAVFVSLVIAEGKETEVLFEGEDGEAWGWKVESYKLTAMTKEWHCFREPVELSKAGVLKLFL